MSEKTTTHHYDGERHIRTTVVRHDDGSKRITTSKVYDSPLGSPGAKIIRETHVDSGGNSYTKRY
jgi:hypothetical protein